MRMNIKWLSLLLVLAVGVAGISALYAASTAKRIIPVEVEQKLSAEKPEKSLQWCVTSPPHMFMDHKVKEFWLVGVPSGSYFYQISGTLFLSRPNDPMAGQLYLDPSVVQCETITHIMP